jgi:hypothetical protein
MYLPKTYEDFKKKFPKIFEAKNVRTWLNWVLPSAPTPEALSCRPSEKHWRPAQPPKKSSMWSYCP